MLDFQVDADALSPGDEVYAGFAVQLIAASVYEADVVVTTDTSAALAGTTANYVYTTSATCDEAAYDAGTDEDVTTFNLDAVTTPVFVCFRVTAGPTLPQGSTGSIAWTFTATSGDTL